MALRVGVAGLRRGSGPCQVFQHHKDCEVVAVCDLNAERAETFARENCIAQWFSDYSELCAADLEAIFVATPAPLHVPHAIEALAHGKHVLSEVPAVYNLEQAYELKAAVEASDRKYMFAENMAYFAWVETYRQMVERGDLGNIMYAECEYIHNCETLLTDEEGKPTWRATLPPIQYCTHDLGPILQMLGDRVVSAVGMHTGSQRRPDLGTIDMEVALFRTAGGRIIKFLAGFAMAKEPAHHWFTLYGTKGQIEGPRHSSGKHLLYREDFANLSERIELPLSHSHPRVPPEALLGGHGSSEYFMVNDFVRCILDNTKPAIDVYEGLEWSVPGICAHQSAEQGGAPVAVPDLRQR
jgi:predicted dehydrogenase